MEDGSAARVPEPEVPGESASIRAPAAVAPGQGTPIRLGNDSLILLSSTAFDSSRMLWETEELNSASPEKAAATIELVCANLRVGLGRWIGADGYRVLLERVLAEAGIPFPELRNFHCLAEGDGEGEVLAAIRATGAERIIDAFATQVAWLIHLLSQLIGEEMAHLLVEQAWMATPSRPPAAPVSRSAS